jgi:hypothetical protein
MRVPIDLLPLYGKTEVIRRSLGTSNRQEAIHLVRFEAYKLDAEFRAKRREMEARTRAEQQRPKMLEIGDRDAHDIAVQWLISLERETQDWWEQSGRFLQGDANREAIENFGTEATVFNGGSNSYPADDGSGYSSRTIYSLPSVARSKAHRIRQPSYSNVNSFAPSMSGVPYFATFSLFGSP